MSTPAAIVELQARRWQDSAEAVYKEAASFRRQVEAFTSQLGARQHVGAETLVAVEVDLTIFRQRLEGLERRIQRLEQIERSAPC